MRRHCDQLRVVHVVMNTLSLYVDAILAHCVVYSNCYCTKLLYKYRNHLRRYSTVARNDRTILVFGAVYFWFASAQL